jgi:hypothetical protein
VRTSGAILPVGLELHGALQDSLLALGGDLFVPLGVASAVCIAGPCG